MSKQNQLLGVANNLANSFVSPTNLEFLKHIETLPIEKTELFEIDLLTGTINPADLMSEQVKTTIAQYRKWLAKELENLKLNTSDIKRVTIKVSHEPGKQFGNYYTCNVTIISKGKEYTKKVHSSYS